MFEYDLPYYFAGLPVTRRQVPRKLAWLQARGESSDTPTPGPPPWASPGYAFD